MAGTLVAGRDTAAPFMEGWYSVDPCPPLDFYFPEQRLHTVEWVTENFTRVFAERGIPADPSTWVWSVSTWPLGGRTLLVEQITPHLDGCIGRARHLPVAGGPPAPGFCDNGCACRCHQRRA